jgi:lysophospholipase L1-like esterase
MLYKIAAVLLLPLLIVQGKRVRKNALTLPEANGERNGVIEKSGKPELSILILGDSAAAGVGVSQQKEALQGQLVGYLKEHFDVRWALLARTGAQTQDLIPMLTDAKLNSSYDIIITSLGVNDVTSLQRSKSWLNEQVKLHQFCIHNFNAKHIIVSGMPPMHKFPLLPQPLRWIVGSRAKAFDRMQASEIKKFANKSYAALNFDLDETAMAKDGFHPGAPIYKAWAKALSERVYSILQTN